MSSIVIALPKIEDAKKIRAILVKHGFSVASSLQHSIACSFKRFRIGRRNSDLWLPASGYVLSGFGRMPAKGI